MAKKAEVRKVYALIGQVASGWSHIEQSVDVTLWRLAGVEHQIGACLTAQIQGLSYRLHALAALVEVRLQAPSLAKEIRIFEAHCVKLSTKRNRVVHDPITLEDDGTVGAVTIQARRSLKYGISGNKIAEYEAIGAEILDALRQYLAIDQKLISAQQSLLDRLLESPPASRSPRPRSAGKSR